MSGITRVAAVLAATALMACQSTTPPDDEPQTSLQFSASALTVPADGTSTVTLTVAAGTSVKLTATRGTFQGTAGSTLELPSGNGTATLVTCDSREPTPCAGLTRVSAVAIDGAVASVSITFQQLEMCANGADDDKNGQIDCADPACLDRTCTLAKPAVGTGVCGGGGKCLCAGGATEVCNDGVDNNCDGKVDCLETTCANKSCTTAGGAGGVCAGTTCACRATEICNNGTDDTCDGEVDCADPDCQPVGNNLGGTCDARGNTCSPLINGKSTCSSCSGNGASPELNETTCGDNRDNDCDGITDCQDANCGARTCTSTGKRCDAETLTCVCAGGNAETTCDNNADDDCDGKTDCADTDCQAVGGNLAATCGANGKTCSSTGTCACSGNGKPAEATEASCNDGIDNDCDGLADCEDPNCRATTSTSTDGKNCSNPTASPVTVGKTCNATGQCICAGGQLNESLCSDASDNDCDGFANCQDTDCGGQVCGPNGRTCSGSSCVCPTGLSTEASACGNSKDDDCDGLADCSDPDCNSLSCSSISANYVCEASTCKDKSSAFSLVVTATPSKVPANGTATSTVSATLKEGTTLQGGRMVDFEVIPASAGTVSPTSATTSGSGVAVTTFTSSAAGGAATVRAHYYTGTQDIYGSIIVEQPLMGPIRFVSQTNSIMGVRYSSFNETNQITFQVFDSANQPYPAGLGVTFTHVQVGGSYIGAAPNCTAGTCTASATTDANGNVRVNLTSGTVASVVSVRAEATAGGVTANTVADNIAVVGAKASGSHISIDCTPRNVSAFADNDCTNSKFAGSESKITCTAAFADRFNNVLARATQATFSTEAGAASQPSFTGTTAQNLGQAIGQVSVTGYQLPVDVAPDPGEYSFKYDSGCGERVHNPRDGLVTVIVSANGEEGFVDGSNGFPADGVYQLGENFVDIGEPFVDANDNRVRDANEPYVDTNSNTVWDGPNGVWNENTSIWAQTRVLYSDLPRAAITATGQYSLSRWFDFGAEPMPTPSDPARFDVISAETAKAEALPGATSQRLRVLFTDRFFNPPSQLGTYTVTTVSGTVASKFISSPQTVATPPLGMTFTQQFCPDRDGTAGGCANACNSSPCYVVTRVSDYVPGRFGVVEITGGAKPDASPVVRVEGTLHNYKLLLDVAGTSR